MLWRALSQGLTTGNKAGVSSQMGVKRGLENPNPIGKEITIQLAVPNIIQLALSIIYPEKTKPKF